MKRIIVYADFDFLTSPEEIGLLGYEHVRGKDHFVFEYSRQWLKQHGGILLSGDLMNVPSMQHPHGNDNVFGFVKDSFPDRWGRLLLDRGAEDNAVFYTLLESCAIVGINPLKWLTHALERIRPDMEEEKLIALLPYNCKAEL